MSKLQIRPLLLSDFSPEEQVELDVAMYEHPEIDYSKHVLVEYDWGESIVLFESEECAATDAHVAPCGCLRLWPLHGWCSIPRGRK